jgi:hypothetical protein
MLYGIKLMYGSHVCDIMICQCFYLRIIVDKRMMAPLLGAGLGGFEAWRLGGFEAWNLNHMERHYDRYRCGIYRCARWYVRLSKGTIPILGDQLRY